MIILARQACIQAVTPFLGFIVCEAAQDKIVELALLKQSTPQLLAARLDM